MVKKFAGPRRQPVRLFTKGTIMGFKRSKTNQYNHTTLLKVDGLNQRSTTDFYLGKRVVYIYRAPTSKQGTKVRTIWGRITKPHGNGGVVRAKFQTNLPPRTMGAKVRVMLYPSRV